MIPNKGGIVNQNAPVSAYIAVSPKSNQPANQYKYTGQLVYKDGSPLNRSQKAATGQSSANTSNSRMVVIGNNQGQYEPQLSHEGQVLQYTNLSLIHI